MFSGRTFIICGTFPPDKMLFMAEKMFLDYYYVYIFSVVKSCLVKGSLGNPNGLFYMESLQKHLFLKLYTKNDHHKLVNQIPQGMCLEFSSKHLLNDASLKNYFKVELL